MLRAVSFSVLLCLLAAAPVAASDGPANSPTPVADAVAAAAHEAAAVATPVWALDRRERRPAALPVLYASYAGLQAMDVYSTQKALSAGATEANPVMRSGAAAQIAIKAAAGAATIYFSERAWKKNRAGAIVLMAVLNGATAAIAARNAQHARR
jgi:hypothetical protein